MGFIKGANRKALNKKLIKIRQGENTKEAIKDVLEYTMKSRKDQFTDELKKMEHRLRPSIVESRDSLLKIPEFGRARTKSSVYTSNILSKEILI